jgi:hypothetical protein
MVAELFVPPLTLTFQSELFKCLNTHPTAGLTTTHELRPLQCARNASKQVSLVHVSFTAPCSLICIETGHFIYECKAIRPYVSRPSRTQQLEKPGVLAKLKVDGKPSVEVPEEFKTKYVPYCCTDSAF